MGTDRLGRLRACALIAALTPACNAIFGLNDLEVVDGSGGSTSVSGSSSSGSGGNGGANCDCPAPPSECLEPSCDDGPCSTTPKPAGSACNEAGGGYCDGAGMCVECTEGSHCPTGVCDRNECVDPGCMNGAQDGTETDTDCGGDCPACSPGKMCGRGSDCLSGVCTGGVCQAPTCVDGAQNGTETDLDCGGPCPGCADGLTCQVNADCASLLCDVDTCVAPSCTDGVQNGGETDVDCGGTCDPCMIGDACIDGADCVSGLCTASKCALLNGCGPATAVDLTASVMVTVNFSSQDYDPPCFRITAGTPVTFQGNFTGHDLYGGEVVGNMKVPDPMSPFMPPTTNGNTKTFNNLTTVGAFGFYCEPHALNGMKGAVFVE